MRTVELKLIITFHTTTDAMAMEQVCRDNDIPGRLIPVPKSITAGCGLAWCAAPAGRAVLEEVLEKAGIKPEALQECLV
ncbi:MAG: DUF3343 domain-containing protein [Clostridiales bacterium]|nr:DUF3343 domain-containing protein [Clostridiales bacterium]